MYFLNNFSSIHKSQKSQHSQKSLNFSVTRFGSNFLIKKKFFFSVFNNYPQSGSQSSWPRLAQTHPQIQYSYATSSGISKQIPDQLRILGFTILADLVERAGLSEALKSRGPFTVFAPTDRAFQRFIGQRGDEYRNDILSDKTLLQYILLQHVAPGKLRSNELYNDLKIKTLADNTLNILDTRDGLTVAGDNIWL